MNIIIIDKISRGTDSGCGNVVSFAAYAARRRAKEFQPILWGGPSLHGGDVVNLAEWRCR